MRGSEVASNADTAMQFFEVCEAGKGWEACSQYCTSEATFSAQADPLAEIKDLEGHAEWMKGLMVLMPDGAYDLKAFAIDDHRDCVVAYAVFSGTHTGEGGPVPPSGRSVSTHYVYVMKFEGDKIGHMTKIWNSGIAMQQLGWV
jgi:predicted ester cyclase